MSENKDTIWFDNKMKEIQEDFATFSEFKKHIIPWFEAFKIIIVYIAMGVIWILLSDRILSFLVHDPQIFQEIQLYKGWLYVLVTGVIFYFIISNKMKLFKIAIDKIFQGYEELSAAHEELISMDEELNQQYQELEKHRNALITSSQRYQLVVEGVKDGIWDWDLKNNIYFFSITWKRTFGYTKDELAYTVEAWEELLHPEDRQKTREMLQNYLKDKGSVYENIYRARCKNGQYRWILSRGKGVWDTEGNPIRIAGSHTDITDQIHLQEFLRREKELSENIIRDAPMIILVLDAEGKITQFNPFAEKITGYTKEEVLGKNGVELMVAHSDKKEIDKLFEEIKKGNNLNHNETDIVSKNGCIVTVLWNNNLLHDQHRNIQGVVFIGLDITERRAMENRLHTLAYYDVLTQLPNRIMLDEVVRDQIVRARVQNKKIAFVYLGIDNFKHINDTMGHDIGDQLVIYIANVLCKYIQQPHSVARVGGDEFAIVLVDLEDQKEVIPILDKILHELRKPWTIEQQEFFISVSMGVAIYPDHGMDLSKLMQNSDMAMFHVKENGRDAYCIFNSEMREKTWQYIQMSNQLRIAVNNQEFSLYYQPQIDLNTHQIIGMEAHIRWIHPEKGFISPMEFIPFAEQTGYIAPIEYWVFQTACEQKRKWGDKGYKGIKMCINLSSKMLTQEGLVERIKDALQRYDIQNNFEIELEITETAIVADFEKAIDVLHQLKKLGIKIALDDFGTGYSSLTYLQKLPIDILKVDREFIKNIANEDEEGHIFGLIVDLAHKLGLKVVAEGVETKEQLAFLKKKDCDIAQGYYFSRPIPSYDMELLLKEHHFSNREEMNHEQYTR